MKLGQRTGVLLAATILAAATGCSTKAEDGGGDTAKSGGGEIKTGRGVTGDTIKLGVLTDLTGTFASLGADITNANTLYWEKQNAGAKVCDGKYKIELDIKDTGYVPQQGVQLYSTMKDNVLAMQQTIGSPINTALADQYLADNLVNLPSAWAKNLTDIPGNGVVGATYDVEMTNALGYALEKGLIKEGATIGHIYFEGEYGANGLAGSKYMATKHGFKIIEAKVKATDTDMSSQITQFKAAGVTAIALTTGPAVTASAAGVAATQGLDVPIIGSNPVFAPGLLKGPAAAALKKNLIISSPTNTYEKQQQLLKDYKAKYPNSTPSLGVIFGTGMSEIMKQILEKACSNGDLTPEGMIKAKSQLTDIDTGELVVPLNFSKTKSSPSVKNFILQPADTDGGVKALSPGAYESPDAKGIQ